MKIDRSSGTPSGAGPGSLNAPANKVAEATSPRTADTQVQISKQVQDLTGQLASATGTFDAKKVDQIKAAIADGRFQVNADKVADGVLTTASDLIRSRPRSA
jgi:negative regulator of flagellin synthesis FlgM